MRHYTSMGYNDALWEEYCEKSFEALHFHIKKTHIKERRSAKQHSEVIPAAAAQPFNFTAFPEVRDVPSDMRPREKLLREGAPSLSDKELLAILLNTGVHGKNVFELATDILELIDSKDGAPSIKELSRLSGMGLAKSCAIAATLEFGRRRWGIRGMRVSAASDVYPLVRHYAGLKQERLIGISLNGAREILATRVITIGLVNQTVAHPREVFADMIADRANAAIIAHNHPSGILQPSTADDAFTKRLIRAGKILGIRLLDHLIFTAHSYYSYSQSNRLGLGGLQPPAAEEN